MPFVLKVNKLTVILIEYNLQIYALSQLFCSDFYLNQPKIFLSELNTDQTKDSKKPLANQFFRKI